jgi:small subunit ribosomal protein S8
VTVVSDPIADMLTRIRNAVLVRHESVLVPNSRMKQSIAKILKDEGFIANYEVTKDKPQSMIKIQLKYTGKNDPVLTGLERVSKPGLRVYVGRREIPRVAGSLGVALVSTSQGIMTGQEAWRRGLGGELLCYVM